ncbi:hypothetical protein EZV62_008413 [Acer yangbiense]|uniref:Aminotransferase-like plant mobile domain-containing protein n=1 Tax=Acer yangbiense TaxID=1000413 RepID=A0A5C7IDM7_9ROSI|nr:hypothetical protein EZV62_008413 [Acer yangbiense]
MEEFEDFGFVEREELMISPTGDGEPTFRSAHFLQPTVTSIDGPVFEIPNHCISSIPPTFEPKNWPLEVKYYGWRQPTKEWRTWVENMCSLHESTWKKSGIREAILSSTYEIHRNNDLVLGLAEKWCPDTKSFIFSWGEATITLEDLLISGYSVLGSAFFSGLETEELKRIEQKLNQAKKELNRSASKKASYGQWMKKFMGTGLDIEHEAFLALWLSRFVFPVSSLVIVEAVFPIAIHLSRGTRIALAPPILANIYRDLGLLKEIIVSLAELGHSGVDDQVLEITICSPFQLVQIWAWERFIEFRPKANLIKIGEPRCAQWHKQNIGVGNVRTVLDSAGVSFDWRPYVKTLKNWKLPEFYAEKEMCVSVDADLPEEFCSFALCLRTSELVGIDCVEHYLPHRVAMQFGMDQDLPACVARANDAPHVAWSRYCKPITCEKLYIRPRLYEAVVTTRYLNWWKESMFRLKFECKGVRPRKRAFSSLNSTPRRSKAAKVSCFVGSEKKLKRAVESKYSTKSTKVSFKKSSEKSLKTSKQKKKDINASSTLGSFLKKAKKPAETSKEKEELRDVSASAGSSSKKLPLSLIVKKELNDSLVPPGFAPKFNLVETRDSVDEDDLSITEILRSTNVHREILRSNSLEKSLEKSPKTSKRKKKDINSSVTLGSLLKKAKTPVETSKEKENVCDVSASAGSSSSNKLPPCLTVEEEPNEPSVLPGFAPEFNLVETTDSVDEDDMTIAEILRSKNVRFMDGDNSASHSRDVSSSVADNEAAKIVEPPTKLLEKIMQNEFVKGDSGTVLEDAAERTSGSPDNDTVMIQSSELEGNKYATELLECQLEDRVSRLEKIFAELKAAKFGLSHHN